MSNSETPLDTKRNGEANGWLNNLTKDEMERLKLIYDKGLVEPSVEFDAERQSIASQLTSSVTGKNILEDKGAFKKAIKDGVYPQYKFLCLRDKAFDSNFSKTVFQAIGIDKNEVAWIEICKMAETTICDLRATDTVRVKEAFDSKYNECIFGI